MIEERFGCSILSSERSRSTVLLIDRLAIKYSAMHLKLFQPCLNDPDRERVSELAKITKMLLISKSLIDRVA